MFPPWFRNILLRNAFRGVTKKKSQENGLLLEQMGNNQLQDESQNMMLLFGIERNLLSSLVQVIHYSFPSDKPEF